MRQPYWDAVARRWDAEIFNTLKHDRKRTIAQELELAARRGRRVADLGCGVGTYLPLLSRLFEEVDGFDWSGECVRLAAIRARKLPRVNVHRVVGALRHQRSCFDVVLCVNVAIDPNAARRRRVIHEAVALLRPTGRLLMVVPAMESALLVAEASARHKSKGEVSTDVSGPVDRNPGVVTLDGVPTKHFHRSELHARLERESLIVRAVRKVEYSWQSHGLHHVAGREAGRPWDWLAIAVRNGERNSKI